MKKRKSYSCDMQIKQIIPGTGFYTVHYCEDEPIIDQVYCFALIEKYHPQGDEYETTIEPMQWCDGYMDTVSEDGNFVGVFTEADVKEYRQSSNSAIDASIKSYLESKAREEARKRKSKLAAGAQSRLLGSA
jgi:hypothetical protein